MENNREKVDDELESDIQNKCEIRKELEVEQINNDLEEKKQNLEKRSENRLQFLKNNANLLMVAATFFLAIATFLTVIGMKNANITSQKTLDIMSRNFELSNRPYVAIGEIQGGRKSDKELSLRLYLVNDGRIPANDLSVQIIPERENILRIEGEKIDLSNIRIITSPFPASLFPRQRYVKRTSFSHNKMSMIYAGEKKYILNIDLKYRGLTKIPKEEYYGYFLKVEYNPVGNSWNILESSAW